MKVYRLFYLFLFFSACASTPKDVQFSNMIIKGQSYQKDEVTEYHLAPNQTHVLVFLSPNCPCSNSHLDHLNQLKNKYPEVHFLGVHSNTDESFKQGEKIFQKLNFNIIRDKKAKVANTFGALKTPHVYIIHKGKQVYQGGVTERSNFSLAKEYHLEKALKQIKQGKKMNNINKRTLGCAIARY